MAKALSELEEVRNNTETDKDKLSDTMIQQYLLKWQTKSRGVRILLASADIIDWMLTQYHWQSQTMGSKSASGNLLTQRAVDFRKRAAALEPFVM